MGTSRMRSRGALGALILGAIAAIGVPSVGSATTVLYFEDFSLSTSAVPGALTTLGLAGSTTIASSVADFNTQLGGGPWDLVVVGEQDGNVFPSFSAAMTGYLTGGGRVLASTWRGDPGGLGELLEGSPVDTNGGAITTDAHPLFAGLGPTIALTNPGWGTFSRSWSPIGSAVGVGTLGAGRAAIIGHGGRSILFGPLYDTVATLSDGEALLANAISTLIVPPLDHFACYRANPTKGSAKFVTVPGVNLTDQFGAMSMSVMRPMALCNPANKNGEDPLAPTHSNHLEAYQIKTPRGAPKFTRVTDLEVANQFGTISVDAVAPDRLLVPTAKGLVGPVSALSPPTIDHLKCYRVKPTKGAPKFSTIAGVSVVDQFGSRIVDVKRPTRLCNPVDLDGAEPTAPTHVDHLMCYKTKPVKGAPRFVKVTPVHVNNGFGPGVLDAVRPDELCVPSNKNAVCGNGVLERRAGEQCDDGNSSSEDGCSSTCVRETCGDGIIQPGLGEQCEVGNDAACPGTCQACSCDEGRLRLVGGANAMEGRLEVFHAGQWGTVCDDSFDNTDATVACQQLGFSSGVAQCCAAFGQGVGTIWMDGVACSGAESRLVECPFNGFGSHDCSHGEDVGIVCAP